MKTFTSVAQMKLAFLTAGQQVETTGYYAPGDGGQAKYLVKAPEVVDGFGNHELAGVTVAILQYAGPANVLQFGADPTGVVDSFGALNATQLQMQQNNGADIILPPGTYLSESQWVITAPPNKRSVVWGYGAEIITTGAIAAVALTGGDNTGGCTIYGLQVNHRGNVTATAGFDIYTSWNASLIDCSVECHDTGAGYAGYLLRNGNPADDNTGAFWTLLQHCQIRRRDSPDGTQPEAGVRLRGAANATTISACNLTGITAIHHTNEAGQVTVAGGLVVGNGTAFEDYTTAYHLEGVAASVIGGIRINNCRFEAGVTVFSLTGITSQPNNPPNFRENHITTTAGAYLNNPNSLYVQQGDTSVTPSIIPAEINNGARHIRSLSATHALELQPGGGNKGLLLQDQNGVTVAQLVWTGVATGSILKGVALDLQIQQLQALYFGSSAAISISKGVGTPEGVVTGPVGSLYMDSTGGAGTTLYVKETGVGNTGWVAK